MKLGSEPMTTGSVAERRGRRDTAAVTVTLSCKITYDVRIVSVSQKTQLQ